MNKFGLIASFVVIYTAGYFSHQICQQIHLDVNGSYHDEYIPMSSCVMSEGR